MRKRPTLIIILPVLSAALSYFSNVCLAEKTKAQLHAEVSARIKALEKASDILEKTHQQMTAERDKIEKLRDKATINFQDNAYKVYLKGVLDIHDKVSKPGDLFGEALSMSIEVFKNVAWEPQIWTQRVQKVRYEQMHIDALRRYGKLNRMFTDLPIIMKAPLERFDDDKPPLRSAKGWWRDADGEADAEAELITRKTLIIRNLSEKIVRLFDWEKERIRADRKIIIADLERLKKRLEQLKPSDPYVRVPDNTKPEGLVLKQKTVRYGRNNELLRSIYSYYVDARGGETMHGPCKQFHHSGSVEAEGDYVHGQRGGPWVNYHPTGEVHNKVTYKKGKPVGVVNWWHTNGKKAMVQHFNERGQPYGVHRTWAPDGILASEEVYEDGVRVELRRYNRDGTRWQ